jgi:hypothetical protein
MLTRTGGVRITAELEWRTFRIGQGRRSREDDLRRWNERNYAQTYQEYQQDGGSKKHAGNSRPAIPWNVNHVKLFLLLGHKHFLFLIVKRLYLCIFEVVEIRISYHGRHLFSHLKFILDKSQTIK